MWARQAEVVLGLWLWISPFVFAHDPQRIGLWIHDFGCGALLVVIPLLAHWRPLHRAYLALLPVAAWLIGLGWWQTWGSGIHPDPAYQNWIMVGLLLAMFAVVPSDASRPPTTWQAHGE